VKCICKPDGVGEFERYSDGAWAMPWPYRIDTTGCRPGQCVFTVFAELCNERGLWKASEFPECLDVEAFESLDDERIDR
jgi:hypothetical protein